MRNLVLLFLIFFLCACGTTQKTTQKKQKTVTPLLDQQTFLLTDVSMDETYGYSPKNPVEVGGAADKQGPINERRFLNALAGPNGERVTYYRQGSCCPIESDSDPFGFGQVMLDNYRVTWVGSNDTVSIYINMYDSGVIKAPKGFTIKKF